MAECSGKSTDKFTFHEYFCNMYSINIFVISIPEPDMNFKWSIKVDYVPKPPLTEVGSRDRKIIFLESRSRPLRKADNFIVICDTTV
jgi:hypothetical protein